jgi:2-succinyl-5-enolpyruvyl-6-hydroxy-3-cyclohexene-1-carboxylate synthase
LVVQIGRPLTSSAFERWLDPSQPEGRLKKHVLLARSGWPDPLGTAELVGSGDLSDALERAASALEADAPRSSGWAARWYRAGAVVQECVNQLGERRANGSGELGELDAVRTVLGAQPEGARLIIGNSLPIREVDLLAGPNLNRLEGVALRGASGIDGVVSMATGMALSDNRPNTLLLGDLSFLYDIGGLWATLPLSAPLAIVVLNNGGGRIFEQLPVANAVDAETLTHWTVPHRFDLGAAAKLYGLEHCRVDRISLLVAAIVEAHCRPGATVIEVVVAPDSARNQRSDLINRVRDALVQGGLLSEAPAA